MPLGFIKRTAARSNISQVTGSLLRLLKVKVTPATLEDTLLSHPDYPSMLSIGDALKSWGVGTLAIRTTPDQLPGLPLPFIAHLKTKDGWFITVKKVKEKEIIYIGDTGSEKELSKEEFLENWEGVILLAEAGPVSGQPDYKKTRRKERWKQAAIPVWLLLLLLISISNLISFTGSADNATGAYYTAMLVLSFAGMLVTGALLWYEYDRNNPWLKQVCSLGKKTNCGAVLNSKAAKLPGGLSWSDTGFIYFTGSYLYLVLGGSGVSLLPVIMLNLLAIPYIFFSVYYQARVVKQWCVLCLTVQAILMLGFLSGLFTSQLASIYSLTNLKFNIQNSPKESLWTTFLIFSFLLPAFAWLLIKPSLYAAKEAKQLRYQLARFKSNGGVFEALLHRQPLMQQPADGLGLMIGNPEARHTLTKVCNPYCCPCAEAHPRIEALINTNPEWKVQIIFMASGDERDKRTAPAAHLMAIASESNENNEEDESMKQRALDDWYNAKEKSYEAFAAKYPANGELKQQKEKLQAMDKWCKEVGIAHTPTFFVDGHWLPEQYEIGGKLRLVSIQAAALGP